MGEDQFVIVAQGIMALPEAKADKGSMFLTVNKAAQSPGWSVPSEE